MTTYYYPSDTTFGGAITVGPADEIVNFHGSGVSIDLFGTAISSMLIDGFETVESGGLDSGSTIEVELNVMSGGTVIGLTVDTLVYRDAGEAIGLTLENGTVETISPGGVALGTTVSNATVFVSSGGIDSGSTLYGGSVETVDLGGEALGTTVSNSTVFISSGGIVSGSMLYGRSVETVYSAGEAIGTTVSSGATLELWETAIASGYTISSGGTLRLLNYTLGGYTVSDGVVLDDRGSVLDATVESGGTLSIENWGGGAALASGVVVEGGGTLSMGGGTVSNLTLDSGGVDVVNFGTTVGTTVLGGAVESVLGGAVSNTSISSGGVESIGAGYSFNTTVSGGGVEVLSGLSGVSSASDTTVLSGGELIVATGAIALDAVVAGTEILQGDGEDYDSTIESGGLHVVQYRSEFAVLSGGAEEVVSSGGTAISTTVDSGAIELVSSGGAAVGLTISSGGIAVVSSGGSAGATELEGGYELVASGGIVSNATISAGTLEVASGGAMASPSEVAFAGGGTLQLDGGTGFGWTVAGIGLGDHIDLADVAFMAPTTKKGSGNEVSFTEAASNQSATLTVTDGVHIASIQLLGQYTASEFVAASDGRTLITYTSASTTGGHGHAIASPVIS